VSFINRNSARTDPLPQPRPSSSGHRGHASHGSYVHTSIDFEQGVSKRHQRRAIAFLARRCPTCRSIPIHNCPFPDLRAIATTDGGGGGGGGGNEEEEEKEQQQQQQQQPQPPCTGIFASHTDWVTGLAVAEDRIMAPASYDGTLKLWDLAATERPSGGMM